MPDSARDPGGKAVTISPSPDIIPSSDEPRSYRPQHLLRKSISSKRLHGRPPVSPSMAAVTPPASLSTLSLGDSAAPPSAHTALIESIQGWIDAERVKSRERRVRRAERQRRRDDPDSSADDAGVLTPRTQETEESLDALERLLQNSSIAAERERPAAVGRRSSSGNRRREMKRRSLLGERRVGGAESDTEYASDGEPMVPACEEWLKTPEEVGWGEFKLEVLKLAHTLKCKGWRRVDLSRSGEVEISRISGALTNAVYMVVPPQITPSQPSTPANGLKDGECAETLTPTPKHTPVPLLLRIYGPQVGHLIDRQTELSILRRLARNRIGPRLLGTFTNGRFEQFFTATTLTKLDIRVPTISRHISKRLKELHSGIPLTSEERAGGPIVWKNIHRWLPRASAVVSTLPPTSLAASKISWEFFISTLQKYEHWLSSQVPPAELVFAHNDTQYGNILRLDPSPNVLDSPLLLPQNAHKKYIVIDFEYASANPRGFEFANHFCEWMADYHDPDAPHVMREGRYPSPEEQRNFLRAYVEHELYGGEGKGEEEVEREVKGLSEETRRWRGTSHAMWGVWGVVQAGSEEEAGEFDYLGYAGERLGLFWGDMVGLGLVEEEEVIKQGGRIKKIEA